MKININDIVKVKLTEHGRAVQFVSSFNSTIADQDGFISIPMHVLMSDFGKFLTSGSKQCFENNQIYLIESTQTGKERIEELEHKIDKLTEAYAKDCAEEDRMREEIKSLKKCVTEAHNAAVDLAFQLNSKEARGES